MEIPFPLLALFHYRLAGIEQCPIDEVLLALLLHLHDDVATVRRDALHVEDNSSLVLVGFRLFHWDELHVLDFKLACKQSVEEGYEAFLGVLTAEYALESPIDTWVDKFRHTIWKFNLFSHYCDSGAKIRLISHNRKNFGMFLHVITIKNNLVQKYHADNH